MSEPLRERLTGWTDVDVAQFHLAVCLGLMKPSPSLPAEAKHVFWTANPVGDTLYRILDELTAAGVLEKDDDEIRYRWRASFRGSWE